MQFDDYQEEAAKTAQFEISPGRSKHLKKDEVIPLLGLTGEIGALLSEYKKLLRDGPVHRHFRDRLSEELGDTLWYVAAVATKFELSLEDIAERNLQKTNERWQNTRGRAPFDQVLARSERLPVTFEYRFVDVKMKTGSPGVVLLNRRGHRIGDPLTDNAHVDDGYRFHDVMHFAFVAVLGWSPVARKILGRKRRSDAKTTDEVEDGGRAAVIDEAIVAMVFDYIRHDLAGTKGMTRVDSVTLAAIRGLTRGFEVHVRTEAEWEEAILKGLEVWRQVEQHGGGTVVGDFRRSKFAFRPPTRK